MSYYLACMPDLWVTQSCRVSLSFHQFERIFSRPVLRADQPWEKEINLYGSVLQDSSGLYRSWYQILNRNKNFLKEFEMCVGYAESIDGLNWIKPKCGIVIDSFGQTNIVIASTGLTDLCSPSVVNIGNHDLDFPYRMVFFDAMYPQDLERYGYPFELSNNVEGWKSIKGEGIFLAKSRDGLIWIRDLLPIFSGPIDACSLAYSKKILLLAHKFSDHPTRHHRLINLAMSNDAGNSWSDSQTILSPDYLDPIGTEFYNLSVLPYEGYLLGLLSVYHNAADAKHLDIQLVAAKDTDSPQKKWIRLNNRKPLLKCGNSGDWDAGRVYPASNLIYKNLGEDNEEIWLYYGAANTRHDDRRYIERHIGVSKIRKDGFASMFSDYRSGWIVTNWISCKGGSTQFIFNINANHGSININFDFGFGWNDNICIRDIDSTRYILIIPINGNSFRVKFELTNANIYGWGFTSLTNERDLLV